ncbi:MlaA family lipoprotein [Actibacterium sp. D379-3]
MTRLLHLTLALATAALSACGTPEGAGEFNDPYETQNREVHEANTSLDRSIVRPVSQAYGTAVPHPVRRSVGNFAGNLSLPGMVVNDLLQFRLEDAAVNTSRFLFNSTIGLAGLFDPASSIGITERSTDFGETLHVWGVGEGNYVELPIFGPSTERDAVGMIVDTAMNPVSLFLPSTERSVAAATKVAAKVGQRYQFSDSVDSILYESADSYAQARLLYLQSRRHALGGNEEPIYTDPYADLYEDPYAE